MRAAFHSALLWVALGSLVACSHAAATTPPASTNPDADARRFALALIDVLERDDLEGWRDMLSAKIRRRTDEGEARRLFDTWRRYLVPHVHALRAADWTTRDNIVRYRAVGAQSARLVKVAYERGALRIDEN